MLFVVLICVWVGFVWLVGLCVCVCLFAFTLVDWLCFVLIVDVYGFSLLFDYY